MFYLKNTLSLRKDPGVLISKCVTAVLQAQLYHTWAVYPNPRVPQICGGRFGVNGLCVTRARKKRAKRGYLVLQQARARVSGEVSGFR